MLQHACLAPGERQIDTPELARQTAARFESMASRPNSYELTLSARSGHEPPHLVWRSEEDGKAVDYDSEPARSGEQKTAAEVLSLLPLDGEL